MSKRKNLREPTREELERELARVEYGQRFRHIFRGTLVTLLTAAAIAVLLANLVFPVLQVVGSSMTPTLNEGETVLAVKSRGYSPGNVVAFYYGNRIVVERCIAVPGDWVEIREDGSVLVNNQLLDEPYVSEKSMGICEISFPYQVPEGRYFLLGDNRSVSVDSRSEAIGCVSQEQMIGRVLLRFWPFEGFKVIL